MAGAAAAAVGRRSVACGIVVLSVAHMKELRDCGEIAIVCCYGAVAVGSTRHRRCALLMLLRGLSDMRTSLYMCVNFAGRCPAAALPRSGESVSYIAIQHTRRD